LTIQPLISIIVPTRNRAALLSETIESIRQQTYTNWELIIVSDASEDHTALMVRTIPDNRIFLYELTEKANGPGTVRNYGINKATGEWIAFCDDDDTWLPDKLTRQVNYLLANPETDVLATKTYYFQKTIPVLPDNHYPLNNNWQAIL